MQSHPNYKGYDALRGKPNKKQQDQKLQLAGHIGHLEKSDLFCEVPAAWMPKINAVRKWCEERDIEFAPSPFPYQIAKVMAGDFTIVLWASKMKKTRVRYIKPAFEGPIGGAGSQQAMTAISSIVRH